MPSDHSVDEGLQAHFRQPEPRDPLPTLLGLPAAKPNTPNAYYGTPVLYVLVSLIFAIAGLLVGLLVIGTIKGMFIWLCVYPMGWGWMYLGIWAIHQTFTSKSHTSLWPIVKINRQPPPEIKNWDGSRGGPDHGEALFLSCFTLALAIGAIAMGAFLIHLSFLF